MVLNIASPIIYGIFTVVFYEDIEVAGKEVNEWVSYSKIVGTYLTFICTLISGTILMHSIFRIKAYFKKGNATDALNAKMLLRHGFSFGIYMLGIVGTTVSLLLYNLNANNPELYQRYFTLVSGFLLFNQVCQLIGEILLCQIFWQWAETSLPDEFPDAEELTEVRVTLID